VPFYFLLTFIWVVCRLCRVGGTEGHLMAALNVLFWDQVAETNQFVPCVLAPLFPDSAAGAFFLFFSVFTLALCCYQHPCQIPNTRKKAEMIATFIIKSEAFMREIFSNYQSRHSA
jgi:hypothetical protein